MATKISPGRYRTTVYLGIANGKRKVKSFYGTTAREADYAAELYKVSHKHGRSTANITIGEAIDGYIDSRVVALSPTTIDGYRQIRRNRFKALMDMQISKLDRRVMQAAVNDELKLTTRRGTPITIKSVKEACALLVTSVKYYDEDFRIGDIVYPRRPEPEYTTPAPDQLRAIFRAVQGTDVELPVYLAAWLSLRTSEIKGLKWSDVRDGCLSITGATVTAGGAEIHRDVAKTASSIRMIPLPEFIHKMFAKIPRGDDEFVFHFRGSMIYKHFERALVLAGLPAVRFHDLRHANASIMLMLGVPDKYAQERGGWASPAVLKSAYQQTFDSAALTYAKVIDDFFLTLTEG